MITEEFHTHQRIRGLCAIQIHVLLTYFLYIKHTVTLPCKYQYLKDGNNSHGSAVTYFRCDRFFNNHSIANYRAVSLSYSSVYPYYELSIVTFVVAATAIRYYNLRFFSDQSQGRTSWECYSMETPFLLPSQQLQSNAENYYIINYILTKN